ncbi:MAG: class I SAM-dependent methyltransferase [Nannocystis sp.]|nr:class I SAM-dependent methyltransferase [Nannocystis sp.]
MQHELTLLPEAIATYVREHTSDEPELFARLRAETQASLADPQMQVGPVEGALLRLLVQISGARRVLEIGTYSGYSALAMAAALPEGGTLTTCDRDPVATAVARRYFDQSDHGSKITIALGNALDTLAALTQAGARFDLAFIDADKESYIDYWEAVMPLLPLGGVIIADNTLWSGRVLAPRDPSDHAIVAFNAHVAADPRVEHVLLSVRDGVMLARKRRDHR